MQNNQYLAQRLSNVLFRNITFNEVTEFNTQGFRPYTATDDTKSVVNNAVNIINERKFNMGRFSPSNVGSITDNMIAVAGASTGNIGISNGWNNRRFMFTINVDVQMSSGGCINYIVSGFTDTNNISIMGNNVNIDPNIELHITNISEGRSSGSGLFISKSDQILTRQHYMNDLSVNGNEFRSQRPMDVFNTITSNMFKGNNTTSFSNTETALGTPVFGNRFNNIPNQYSANIFNSYVDAANANSSYVGENYHPEVAELVSTESAKESYITNNKFLDFLNANNDEFTVRTSFTWGDLVRIDPNIMDRLHVNLLSDRESFLPSSGFVTANTNNRSDLLGQIAAVLGSSIPALATRCNIQIINFIANNTFGVHNVNVINCQSFNPATQRMHGDQFATQLPSQVLDSLFTNMQLVYELSVYCQVNSETFIKLKVHGPNGGNEDFLIPTFAESLFTPTVTNNVNTIDSISEAVKFVTTRIAEESSIGKTAMEAQNMRETLAPKQITNSFSNNDSFNSGINNFSVGSTGF